MTRRATVSQAAIARAVRAVTAHGLTVARIEIAPGGGVTVIAGPPAAAGVLENRHPGQRSGAAAKAEPGQPLTPPAPGVTPDNLDEWRARKHGGRAHQGA
jgi:hypothetical protein